MYPLSGGAGAVTRVIAYKTKCYLHVLYTNLHGLCATNTTVKYLFGHKSSISKRGVSVRH